MELRDVEVQLVGNVVHLQVADTAFSSIMEDEILHQQYFVMAREAMKVTDKAMRALETRVTYTHGAGPSRMDAHSWIQV